MEKPVAAKTYLACAIAISLLSVGSFFAGYQFTSGSNCSPFPVMPPKYYIAYIAIMFANFFAVRQVLPVLELVVGSQP